MALSFVGVLGRTLFGSQTARAPKELPPEPASARLKHLLLAHGRKAGARDLGYYDHEAWTGPDPSSVKLFIEEISPGHILFRTPNRLAGGEVLDLELLLQGVGLWRGKAAVQWSLESAPGFSGMALLDSPAGGSKQISTFVAHQLAQVRG